MATKKTMIMDTVDPQEVKNRCFDAKEILLGIQKTINQQGKFEGKDLIDLLALSRVVQKQAAKLEGIYKEMIKGRVDMDESEVWGSSFKLVISKKVRVTFDSAKLCAEMEEVLKEDEYEEWYEQHSRTTEYIEMSTKPLEGSDD